MIFGAAELVKTSASKLVERKLRSSKKKVTNRMKRGDNFAGNIVKSRNALTEREGRYQINLKDWIYFSVDYVKDWFYMEIKYIEDEAKVENWFIESSILQATLYCTLLQEVETLHTPNFMLEKGVEQFTTPVNHVAYHLLMNNTLYKVYPYTLLLNHYIYKANIVKASLMRRDYSIAVGFDREYKFKEFNKLKPKYSYLGKGEEIEKYLL